MAAAGAIQRRHSPDGASSSFEQSLDVLHQAMRLALYRCIAMAIEIVVNLPAFFVVVDFVVGHNHN